MNKENKPCPFCGSKNITMEHNEDMDGFWPICYECRTEGPLAATEKEAWEIWNKRSGEDGKHSS